ncbi:MAG: hypothetical protein LBE83_02255 [Propionibacteriaceae bacterium]|jgi:putative membrane protein|nr:hypothetical protein [Propionibacteriaceae bacterium]
MKQLLAGAQRLLSALNLTAFPLRGRTALALLLVPVLIAGGLMFANWSTTTRTVKAAVVNLDNPVTIGDQYTPLGRQLTAALVDTQRDENLTWELATEYGAQTGLLSGEYAAVVTIPPEFSAAATSYAADPADAIQATITITTSPTAGVTDATLGRAIAREAAGVLNAMLTGTYLSQIYLGFNEMGEQFRTVTDAATLLADGVEQFVNGLNQAYDGAIALGDGATQLAGGMETMRGLTSGLPGDVLLLANSQRSIIYGTPQQPGGMQALSAGMGFLKTSTATLPADLAALAAGANLVASGVEQYVGGVNSALDMVIASLEQMQGLVDAIQLLTANPAMMTDTAEALRQGIAEINRLAGLSALPRDTFEAGLPPWLACPDQIDQMGACDAYYSGLQSGMAAAAASLAAALQVDTLGPILLALESLPDLMDTLTLPEGGVDILQQLNFLRDSGQQLIDGSAQLAGGVSQLAAEMPALVAGIAQAADGMALLLNGSKLISGGLDQLALGMPELANGISTSAWGAAGLAGGLSTLSSGLDLAAENGGLLSDGSRQLAGGLADGLDQLPNYSASERTTLASVVASPIDTDPLNGTAGFGAGWIASVLILALWLGAFATSLVVRPIRARLLQSASSSLRLIASSLTPGIVVGAQALIIAIIALAVLKLPFGPSLGVLSLLLLSGAMFYLVSQGLVTWLKGLGGLIAIAFAVVAAAGAITGATGGAFMIVRSCSPLTPALGAIQNVIVGGSAIATNTLVVIGWLILGFAATAAAVLRSRTTTLDDLAISK